MDLLDNYGSSSDEDGGDSSPVAAAPKQAPAPIRRLNAAPTPSMPAAMRAKARRLGQQPTAAAAPPGGSTALTLHQPSRNTGGSAGSGSNQLLMNNPLASVLHAPIQGPAACDPDSGAKPQSRGDVGTAVHNDAFDEATFEEERKRFQRTGTAMAPTATGEVVSRGTWGHYRKRYADDANSGPQGPHQQGEGGAMTDGLEQPKRKRDRKSKKSEDAKLKEIGRASCRER